MKLNKKNNKGVTLIALVVTIIVLIILAIVSIGVLGGENGIIKNASEAKKETEIAEEKEGVGLAVTKSRIGDNEYEELNQDNLQNAVNKQFGSGKAIVRENGDKTFTVYFSKSKNSYLVKDNLITEVIIVDNSYINNANLCDTNILVSDITENSVTVFADKAVENAKKYIYYYKPILSSNYFFGGEATNYNDKVIISGLNKNNVYKILVIAVDNKNDIICGSKNIATIIANNVAQVNQTYKENRTYIDISGFTANIPIGAKVIVGESINKGLVINLEGSEFVWIPVYRATASSESEKGKFKEMAYKNETGNYSSILYDFDEKGESSILASNYYEPEVIEHDSQYLYIVNNILKTNYSTIDEWSKVLCDDYNDMIESIQKYGGFYIARYETSLSDDIAKSISGVIPISGDTISERNNNQEILWYGMYALQKAYSSDIASKSVSSNMVWGSQWDAMLNFALTTEEKYKVYTIFTSDGFGKNTGTNDSDILLNIYDLQSNYMDMTMERQQQSFRVTRGKTASGEAPVCKRTGRIPYEISDRNPLTIMSSRMSLYIK